jgi:hypothetical protein
MKSIKIIILAVLVFASVSTGSAQQVSFGPRAGLNIASQSISKLSSYENLYWRPGVIAGLELDLGFTEVFTLSLSMLYDQKGVFDDFDSPPGGSLDLKIDYLEFPILAKIIMPLGTVNPYFFAGPSLGIKLSATGTPSRGSSTNYDEVIGTTDFSFVPGIGLQIALQKFSINVDAGFALGLTNVNQSGSGAVNKSQDFRYGAAFLFAL